LKCNNICDKEIKNCKSQTKHRCIKICHESECGDCKEVIEQKCNCNKSTRKIECYQSEPY